MRVTGIVAVVEPLSFSLNKSLSWAMTAALKEKHSINLSTERLGAEGRITAILPLLQPIRAVIAQQDAFVLMMRARFSSGFSPLVGEDFVVSNSAKDSIGRLSTVSRATEWPRSYLLLSSALQSIQHSSAVLLQRFVTGLTKQLWHSEPINWTTHALALTATGQFLSTKEISESGGSTGVLAIDKVLTILPGVSPIPVKFRKWRGAGNLRATSREDDGSCTQTAGGGTDSGGDFGSGHTSDTGSWGGTTGGTDTSTIGGT